MKKITVRELFEELSKIDMEKDGNATVSFEHADDIYRVVEKRDGDGRLRYINLE